MKKRMTLPAMLVCLFFLISGFGNLNAQSANLVPGYEMANGEVQLIPLQDELDARATLRTEGMTNFPAVLPSPTNAVDAAIVLRFKYLTTTYQYMDRDGLNTVTAINKAYADVVALGYDVWPNLVDQTWKEDMYDLLSN